MLKKPLKLSKLHVRLVNSPKHSKSEAQIDRCQVSWLNLFFLYSVQNWKYSEWNLIVSPPRKLHMPLRYLLLLQVNIIFFVLNFSFSIWVYNFKLNFFVKKKNLTELFNWLKDHIKNFIIHIMKSEFFFSCYG